MRVRARGEAGRVSRALALLRSPRRVPRLTPASHQGYYRRGSAYLFLNNFKAALKDFKTVRPTLL